MRYFANIIDKYTERHAKENITLLLFSVTLLKFHSLQIYIDAVQLINITKRGESEKFHS